MKVNIRPRIVYFENLPYEKAIEITGQLNKRRASKFLNFFVCSYTGVEGWSVEARVSELDSDFIHHPEDYFLALPEEIKNK